MSNASSVKLAILNEAAGHIGAGLFSDGETGQTNTQKSILSFYNQAVEEVLDLRPWSGATRRRILQEVEKSDDRLHSGYTPYQLPKDCVRIATVARTQYQDWYVEEGLLYVYRGEIEIRYNSSETEPTWTAHMIALMGLNLGLKVALSRKDSQSQSDRLDRRYQRLTLKTAQLEGARIGNRQGDLSRRQTNYDYHDSTDRRHYAP